jgi:diketogulonate reductase-like aldo/keto reductase
MSFFVRPFNAPSMMENPVGKSIAEDLGKTPAQVLLRFLTQQSIIVIPKSVNSNRLKENFQVGLEIK